MKILVYNFVQPGEPGKQGGGVTVYQRNLMDALLRDGHEVISMSAGDRYSVFRRAPLCRYGEQRRRELGTLKTLHLYNSPVLAPAHTSFYSLEKYLESAALNDVPQEIHRQFGSIDVFHFQNTEGLTIPFFETLRRQFPRSRILLSAHNYNLVCPQVNLWFRESSACVDYREGHACVNCIGGHGPNPSERNIRRMDSLIALLGARRHGRVSRAIEFTARFPFRLRRLLRRHGSTFAVQAPVGAEAAAPRVIVSDELALPYARYRKRNLQLAASVFDRVIAVSHRTKAVLARHGLSSDLITVSYIGTSHHGTFAKAPKKSTLKDGIHIAYLGYMRADKGFFFFVECLHLIPDRLAATMTVTIAAPHSTGWIAEQLRAMAQKFRSLILYNGYTHQTLDAILRGVDVGVVPVLWEDNLPQVAIEIVSHGVPILTSDRGGASEIASNPDFVFKAGSKREFLKKLDDLASGALPLASFWSHEIRIFSMKQHLDDLMPHYRGTVPIPRVEAPEEACVALPVPA